MFSHDDTRSRILAAACERVSAGGTAGASVRGIAADADVSPALVLHHFGSKDGLLTACDAHVLATISDLKSDALAQGPGMDLLGAVAQSSEIAAPLVRYLARRLVEGGSAVDELVDTMVADAHRYVRAGIETGVIRPSAHEQERTVLLTLWSLGALVLHHHVERLLGFSMLDGPEGVQRWSELGAEVLTAGLLTPEAAGTARSQEANA
jgi:AcrR family transcriptional regulator